MRIHNPVRNHHHYAIHIYLSHHMHNMTKIPPCTISQPCAVTWCARVPVGGPGGRPARSARPSWPCVGGPAGRSCGARRPPPPCGPPAGCTPRPARSAESSAAAGLAPESGKKSNWVWLKENEIFSDWTESNVVFLKSWNSVREQVTENYLWIYLNISLNLNMTKHKALFRYTGTYFVMSKAIVMVNIV